MNYEIVELEEKVVEGRKIRTGHMDPNIGSAIGQLWEDFYVKGFYQSIQNKVNGKAIGLYTNYSADFMEYDCLVCCEVESAETVKADNVSLKIPGGKYAKFIVKGNVKEACIDFWMNLEKVGLDRRFAPDFEEYQNQDMENAEIHMYISIN